MTPFQEFRLWLRRAPGGERFAAGLAAALVLAILGWVLVPASKTQDTLSAFPEAGTTGAPATTGGTGAGGSGATSSTGGVTTGGTTGRIPAGTGTTGAVRGTTSGTTGTTGGVTGTTGSTTGSSTGGGKTCPSSSATGVTASRIKVAVILVEIVGPVANQTFGIATPEEVQSWYQAAIDQLNAEGGVACRTLVPQYFKANPADQNALRQTCLDIASAGVFAVLDAGAYAQFPIVDCFAQAKLPYFGSYFLTQSQQRKNYPWLFDFNVLDNLYHDTLFALKARGFFSASNGFGKLGFLYRDCDKTLIDNFNRTLTQIGVPSSKVVPFSVGCPTALADPSTLQQAILKFQQNGVTHLTTAGDIADFANFTKIAQQQRFKPTYGLGDDSLVPLSYGGQAPDYDNIAGAVAISASRDGEEKTPGSVPTAGTARCDAAFKKKGIGPTYSLQVGAGNACDNLWMFAAAADHAPALRGDALAAGLQAATSIDFSYPLGPNDLTKAGTTFAGQYWRPLEFYRACNCWKLLDRTFKRTYS